MKAAVLSGQHTVEFLDLPDPVPGPGEVVIAMKASGLCGSDFRSYRASEKRNPTDLKVAGHEPCGIIAEIGEGVTEVQIGDRIMMHHYTGCGTCSMCRQGYTQMCYQFHKTYGFSENGGHADYLLAPASTCIPLPDALTYAEGAACACGTGTAFHAFKRLSLTATDTLAVFGQGPVGLSATLFAAALGVRVLAVDVVPERLDLAKTLGADALINASETNPVEALRGLTGGEGPDATLDATGIPEVRLNAVDSVRLWGKVCFVGEGNTTTFNISQQIIHRQLTIYGSWTFSTHGLGEVAQFVANRNIPLKNLITHTFPLEQTAKAYQIFDGGKTGKVVLTWPD